MTIITTNPRPVNQWTDVKASAQGRWDHILVAIGIDRTFLRNRHMPCPCCGGRDRYRWDNKNGNGTFYCTGCGSGDGIKLIRLFRNCSFREALQLVGDVLNCKEIAKKPQCSYTAIKPESDQKLIQANRERLQKTWNESKEIKPGDPVHTYLTVTRKLPLVEISAVLRIHPELPYYDDKNDFNSCKCLGAFHTMLAKVENVQGDLVSIHRTYLTGNGYKAPVPKPKKLMPAIYEGATKGAAIRLCEATDTLILGEGIETVLSGILALGLSGWACISAYGLETVIVPRTVKKIIILADHDTSGTGQKSAQSLAKRMIDEEKAVQILLPPEQGTDWADVVADDSDEQQEVKEI